jgi:signal transduction histidine kinase
MLGEQLIKNERIALSELAKNSYDADASWVKMSFLNFGPQLEVTPKSSIIIEDDGCGMGLDVIRDHWLSPATPVKKLAKLSKDTTPSGRKIQGEKGIGRFAVLKLGKTAIVTTRPIKSDKEYVVNFDFSKYDDDFLTENGKPKDLYLEDLSVEVETRPAKVICAQAESLGGRTFTRKPHGTRVEIANLKGAWSLDKVGNVMRDLMRLQSIFDRPKDKHALGDSSSFNAFVYIDGRDYEDPKANYVSRLLTLLTDNSVFRVENGLYSEPKRLFTFKLNGKSQVLSLKDTALTGLRVFRTHFGEGGEVLTRRGTACGSFAFGFYVFDFATNAPPKFHLDKEDKEIIKDHRIYLYRDGIRVYPYGEPDDDWLRIDAWRGTISAGQFLSNDQVVGFVNISERGNPQLKDKTNREGLIETGNPTDDFICLLQTFLAYVRAKPYAQYRERLIERHAINVFKEEQVGKDFGEIKAAAKGNPQLTKLLDKAEKHYKAERQFLVQRAETTEDLAGVGLSVETASHDIKAVMSRTLSKLDALVALGLSKGQVDLEKLFEDLTSLRGMMGFIDAQLRDIQLLFRSAKSRRKDIRVRDIVDKVTRIYDRSISKAKIELSIEEVGGPLVAKTTDAVLLQLLLNLFDNAVYWLEASAQTKKKIQLRLDGKQNILIFADNGPGVRGDDAPYIFEPFYSGKGEEGRGLGLYIARQLLERHDYSIGLAEIKAQRILSGANFVITFVQDGK